MGSGNASIENYYIERKTLYKKFQIPNSQDGGGLDWIS